MKTFNNIGKALAMAIAVNCALAADISSAEKARNLNANAVQLMKDGKIEEAIRGFKSALDVDPSCMESVHNLGKVLIIGHSYENAREVLEKGLSVKPKDEGCLLQMLQLSALIGSRSEFKKYLDLISTLDDDTIFRDSSVLLLRQGSNDYALNAAQKAVAANQDDPVRWFNQGLAYAALHRDTEALDSYQKATSLKEDYTAAWINAGSILDRQQKIDEAISAYEKAYSADPSNCNAQYNLGRMLLLHQRDGERGLHLLRDASKGSGEGAEKANALVQKLLGMLFKEEQK